MLLLVLLFVVLSFPLYASRTIPGKLMDFFSFPANPIWCAVPPCGMWNWWFQVRDNWWSLQGYGSCYQNTPQSVHRLSSVHSLLASSWNWGQMALYLEAILHTLGFYLSPGFIKVGTLLLEFVLLSVDIREWSLIQLSSCCHLQAALNIFKSRNIFK